ncbi:hypothetical protein B0G75_102220 [Paraburkholderia sp. BL18I3N2]|nr:hypothetical protein B0G75_102220 [Paraburkholderia sp. BL18I3N2]
MLSAPDLRAGRHAGMTIGDKFGIRLMYRSECKLLDSLCCVDPHEWAHAMLL